MGYNTSDFSVREGFNTLLNLVSLNSVTAAANGTAAETAKFRSKSVFIAVSGNTGAVTVTIQASPDNSAWYDLDAKTYTAENLSDIFSYIDTFPYMRVKTSTQSNSTVKATITGQVM